MEAVDNILEEKPWGKNSGPGIGDGIPDDYGTDLIREYHVKGKAYTSWLSGCHRPVLANTGKLSLGFDLMTDDKTPLSAQALEFDTRLVIGKNDYNFGSQFNYQRGGLWQVWVNKTWVDTTFKPGLFTPWKWYTVRFDYSFDVINKKYSYEAANVSPAIIGYAVPVTFKNLTATPLNWTDTCNFQVQQDLNYKAGEFTIYIKNAGYTWT